MLGSPRKQSNEENLPFRGPHESRRAMPSAAWVDDKSASVRRLGGCEAGFDYDAAVFPDLWKAKGEVVFKGYLRHYLSDYRPMWVELRPR